MSRVIFLLEEYSMKALLEGLLPRFFPKIQFLCLSHEGKQDLERSVPRKLRAWREPGVRFVVVLDNDGSDCESTKRRLKSLCKKSGRPDTLVRLACQELEAWYFGEIEALARGYSRRDLRKLANKARFRDPDQIPKPSILLENLIPEFQKVSGARLMSGLLSADHNKSRSYKVFLQGVRRIAVRAQRSRRYAHSRT